MKTAKMRSVLLVLGVALLVAFVIVMAFEIMQFSPYNTRWFLWSDRALEFLLPSTLCFVLGAFLKDKNCK